MAKDKTTLASSAVTALVGTKTISSVTAYRHGVVVVLEVGFSDASTKFIKFTSNDGLEIGGTVEAGTGTKVAL